MREGALFETERLVVRPWRLDEGDLASAFEMYGDPEVVKYIGGRLQPSLEATRTFMEGLVARFVGTPYGGFPVVEKASGQVVGVVLLEPLPDRERVPTEDVEVGWHLARRVWGRGFATEAARGLLHYGFEQLGHERLLAVVEPPNARSSAVARRLGMRHLGRTEAYYGGIELELYELGRADWRVAR